MAIEERLAEILAKLEEMNALWLSPAEQQTPSSPPMTNILTADTEEPEVHASSISTKAVMASSASFIPPATLAPPQDMDPSLDITEFFYIHHTLPVPLVSIDGDFCVPFDADDGGTDCLSLLPDSLLRDIVSRLPLKDAARTSVLSHRWSPIWHAALFIVDPVDLTVLHLNPNHYCDQVPGSLAGCWSRSACSSMAAAPDSQIGVTKLLIMAHTRCSTPSPYQVCYTMVSIAPPLAPAMSLDAILDFPCASTELAMVVLTMGSTRGPSCDTGVLLPASTTLMPVATFWAPLISTAMLLVGATITKHLHATSPTNINHRKGNKIPKPPWLLGTKVYRSWSGRMQLVHGFLLEISPWCSDYTLWVQWQPSLIPPAQRGVPGNDMLLRSMPWPSFSQDPARVEIVVMILVWIVWCIHNKQEVFKLKPPWPPPDKKIVIPQPCVSCGFGWPNTGCSCFHSYWEIHMCKLHWLQFLESVAQVDEDNIRGATAIFLSNLYHIWIFTEIVAVGKPLLLNGQVYFITYFWSSYTFQLEENYAQLDLKEDNLINGHYSLLKYAIGYMVLASNMVSESITSGWLVQVQLWLMSWSLLRLTSWTRSVLAVSLHVAMAARMRAWMVWCCYSMEISVVNLLAYSIGQLGKSLFNRLLEVVESAHISSLFNNELWQSVASARSDNCVCKWSFTTATWAQIGFRSMVSSTTRKLSKLMVEDFLLLSRMQHMILWPTSIKVICIDTEGAVRVDSIAYQTLPLSTHIALPKKTIKFHGS